MPEMERLEIYQTKSVTDITSAATCDDRYETFDIEQRTRIETRCRSGHWKQIKFGERNLTNLKLSLYSSWQL